jgi:hypothetical protein
MYSFIRENLWGHSLLSSLVTLNASVGTEGKRFTFCDKGCLCILSSYPWLIPEKMDVGNRNVVSGEGNRLHCRCEEDTEDSCLVACLLCTRGTAPLVFV